MPIPYFTNRTFKIPHAIDRVLAQRQVVSQGATADISTVPINTYIYNKTDWQIDSINFNFSNTTSRDYTVSIATGATIVANRNDFLFIEVVGYGRNQITLNPGFYTGTTLAVELQNELNILPNFSTNGITFTVSYNATTGQFTITCTSGQYIKYIDFNKRQVLPLKQSIAGYLFGLTNNTSNSTSTTIVSDTNVYGLNMESWVIEESGSNVTTYYNDDLHVLSVNQALHITTSNAAGLIASYVVNYENIV